MTSSEEEDIIEGQDEAAHDPLAAATVQADTTESAVQPIDPRVETEKFRDLFLRKAAEFDNYKRRTDTEWQNFQRLANERILLSFLPIVDDLARSLKSGREQKSFDAFYQGVELIQSKIIQTLKANGVDPMEAVGKTFSVDEHDALMQIPRADVPPHTIVEEVEKGYRMNDRVLRHAKVIVSGEVPTAPGTDGADHGKA